MSWDVGRNSPLQAFFFCHLKTGICGHLWTGCPTLHEPSQRQSTLRFTKHVSLHDFLSDLGNRTLGVKSLCNTGTHTWGSQTAMRKLPSAHILGLTPPTAPAWFLPPPPSPFSPALSPAFPAALRALKRTWLGSWGASRPRARNPSPGPDIFPPCARQRPEVWHAQAPGPGLGGSC